MGNTKAWRHLANIAFVILGAIIGFTINYFFDLASKAPELRVISIIQALFICLLLAITALILKVHAAETEETLRAHTSATERLMREQLIALPKLVTDPNKILELATNMMRNTTKTIHYEGAAGFLTDDAYYRIMKECIVDRGVGFVRLLDVKKISEMRKVEHFDDKSLGQYRNWLMNQLEFISCDNYSLYDSEASPLWGRGINTIIRDEVEVLSIFGKYGQAHSAIHTTSGEYAKSIVDHLTSVTLRLKRLEKREVKKILDA